MKKGNTKGIKMVKVKVKKYDPESLKDALGSIPLRSTNIAPSEGESLVGFVPYGLSKVTGPNMAGKTRLLSAIAAIPLKRINAKLFTRTRGTDLSSVSLGAAELRVETVKRAGGDKTRTRRNSVAEEGPITELPDPIEDLITAKHRKGDDAAWRARMAALNAFHPVEVTEERLSALTGPEFDSWLANEHAADEFESLLAAADGLRKELRRRLAEIEEDRADAESHLDRAQGVSASIVEGAMEEFSQDESSTVRLLSEAPAQPKSSSYDAHARLAKLLGKRETAEAVREQLGQRPDVEKVRKELAAIDWAPIQKQLDDLYEKAQELKIERTRLQEKESSLAFNLSGLEGTAVNWDHQKAILDDAPSSEEISEADSFFQELKRAEKVIELSNQWKASKDGIAKAKDSYARYDRQSAELEDELAEVWVRLGSLMTEAIDSKVVRVESGSIQVKDDGGEWINASDNVELSEGRLRRLFLDFWLERAEPGQNVVVPDRVMYFVDAAGRREISKRAVKKKIRLLFEEHAEHDGLQLSHYGG